MSKIERFEDLDCWKAARDLVNYMYDICENAALSKDFETKNQIRRAALSTMNNIAEGFGRFSRKEFIRYLDISQSSALEVKSMAYILLDRKYITESQFAQLTEKTVKVVNLDNGLIKYLNTKLK